MEQKHRDIRHLVSRFSLNEAEARVEVHVRPVVVRGDPFHEDYVSFAAKTTASFSTFPLKCDHISLNGFDEIAFCQGAAVSVDLPLPNPKRELGFIQFPGAPVSPTSIPLLCRPNPAAAAADWLCWQAVASADPAH